MDEYELNEKQLALYDLISQFPPNMEQIRKQLDNGQYDGDELSIIANQYAWNLPDCEEDVERQDSTYLYKIIALLLEYGMNPNYVYNESDSFMWNLIFMVSDFNAADTLALLLEKGADPYLLIDGQHLFDEVLGEIAFAITEVCGDRIGMEGFIHCFLVMIGYGAKYGREKLEPIRICEKTYNDSDFKLEDFKNHRNYFTGITNLPSQGERWTLHVFDKKTLWEVARF